MEYALRTVRSSGSTVQPAEVFGDYFAYRLDLLGVDYTIESTEQEGRTYAYAFAVDDAIQMVTVAGGNDVLIMIATLTGETGAFALDERTVSVLSGSVSLPEEADRTTIAGDRRFDGELPEFEAPDRGWRWLADIDDGYIIVGRIDRVPVVVAVSAVTHSGTPADPGDTDGNADTGAAGRRVFTGETVYTLTPSAVTDDGVVLMLTGPDHTYRLELTPLHERRGSGEAPYPERFAESDDLVILIEHYLILDEPEAER
jgi:hypothetical protein